MAVTIRALTLDEVKPYLVAQHPCYGSVLGIVLHHTYRPNQTTYRGLSSLEGIRSFHINSRGWEDIGANFYAAPDGKVWTARPLSWKNWAHGFVSRGDVPGTPYRWDHVEKEARAIAYPNRQFFNRHCIGIETIANFDSEPCEPIPPVLETSLGLIAIICKHYHLGPNRVFFHRDVADKSCPGKHLSRDFVRSEVENRLMNKHKLVWLPGSIVLGEIEVPPDLDVGDMNTEYKFLNRLGHDGKFYICKNSN